MFAASVNYGTGKQPFSVAIGDLKNDAEKLILPVANYGNDSVSIVIVNGDGTIQFCRLLQP
jgi:hypothetical protein